MNTLVISFLKKEKNFLLSLFFISIFVRCLVFGFFLSRNKNYWQIDSNAYHKIAVGISQGEGFSMDGKPQFYRLPGYSLFLSLYYKLFGIDTKNVLWIQIFLASFIPVFIFFLSLVLFPQNLLLAKFSSIYSAIHLGLVLYSGFFMTESIFIFLFLLFSILFFSSFNMFFCNNFFQVEKLKSLIYLWTEASAKVYKKIFFAGIFLGLASLVRPVGHYLIFLSIIFLFFSKDFFKQKILKSIFLFLGWLIPVAFWLVRNYLMLGQIFFHTLPGGHFLYFSATRVAMYSQNCSYQQARENLQRELDDIVVKKEKELNKRLNEIELCNIRMNLALSYFKKYPFLSIKNWITDIIRTSLSLYSAELVYLDSGRKSIDYFAKERSIWSMFKRYLFPKVSNKFLLVVIFVEIIFFTFILIGFFLGLLRSVFMFFKLNSTEKDKSVLCSWIKSLPFISIFLIIGLSGGFNRMRLPIEPFLIILAFSFWIGLFVKNKKNKPSPSVCHSIDDGVRLRSINKIEKFV